MRRVWISRRARGAWPPTPAGLLVRSLGVGVAERGLGGQVGDVLPRLLPQLVQLFVVRVRVHTRHPAVAGKRCDRAVRGTN